MLQNVEVPQWTQLYTLWPLFVTVNCWALSCSIPGGVFPKLLLNQENVPFLCAQFLVDLLNNLIIAIL